MIRALWKEYTDEDAPENAHSAFIEAKIELREREGGDELAVTGTQGYVLSEEEAEEEAYQYWLSYFEEDRENLADMALRFGTRTPEDAARLVVDTDGRFHGLDIHKVEDGRVYINHSFGMLHDAIREHFPEVAPLLAWHLNGMNAGCRHQKALGWGHGYTVALSPSSLTKAQADTLGAQAEAKAKKARGIWIVGYGRKSDYEIAKDLLGDTTVDSVETVVPEWRRFRKPGFSKSSALIRRMNSTLTALAEKAVPAEPFRGAIYTDSIGAPCPECGYCYGSEWRFEPLPADILALAKGE